MTTIQSVCKLLCAAMLLLGSYAYSEVEDGVPYTRIYTDAAGESHFEDGLLALDMVELVTGSEAGIYSIPLGESATMLVLEPGAFEDWHPSPAPQFLVVIQGISEVGVSDGELRQFGPGSLILMEDTGIGHTTATVGEENHIGLMIPVSQE